MINNCGWKRMMGRGREIKSKKRKGLTIVDGAE
jgi:hypothetical protein